jgi:hypothetical protein
METAPFLSVSLLLCCTWPLPLAAQQIQSRNLTAPSPVTKSVPAGEVLRRRLLNPLPQPMSEPPREEPLIRLHTFALRLPLPDTSRGQAKTKLSGLDDLYDTAAEQRQRFRETAQPMAFECHGIYFRRDLYSTTKGLILHRFLGDRIDIGLYKRRYQNAALPITGRAMSFNFAEATNKSYVFSDGRQIFVGVRFKLGKIF